MYFVVLRITKIVISLEPKVQVWCSFHQNIAINLEHILQLKLDFHFKRVQAHFAWSHHIFPLFTNTSGAVVLRYSHHDITLGIIAVTRTRSCSVYKAQMCLRNLYCPDVMSDVVIHSFNIAVTIVSSPALHIQGVSKKVQ